MGWKNREELLEYARMLEGRSVSEANGEHLAYGDYLGESAPVYGEIYRGKGSFGEFLEEKYFGKENDNLSKADFSDVGIELKAVPLKTNNNGVVRVKERIVLNKFRYCDIVNEQFDSSHFILKNGVLLLVFYFHNNTLLPEDKEIDLVDIWEVLKHDIEQIRADWELIVAKVRAGKAHEISEGDTLYLGACTKGATAASSMQKQPYSDIKAPGRALCFKVSYANMIYHLLRQEKDKRPQVAESSIYGKDRKWIPLEKRIHQLVDRYVGMTGEEIYAALERKFDKTDKGLYAHVARYMLGFSSSVKQYYEFEAADIQVKSVRVEANGTVKESMSFKNIPFMDILYQDWEDSDFYNELTSKFIFMVFRKCSDRDDYCFKGFLLWNMPADDLDKARIVWEKAKKQVLIEDFEHMPGKSESDVAHVRPKGKDSNDLVPTSSGEMVKKKCFWLNNSYIRGILSGAGMID